MCVFLYSMLHCLKYRIRISFRGLEFYSNGLEHVEVATSITITITITIRSTITITITKSSCNCNYNFIICYSIISIIIQLL